MKKNFVFIVFYFALILAVAVSCYFYLSLSIYRIVVYAIGGFLLVCLLHMVLFGGRRRAAAPRAGLQGPGLKEGMAGDGPSATAGWAPRPVVARVDGEGSNMMAVKPQMSSPQTQGPVSPDKKPTAKPVNALQDILKSAYQNDLLTGGRALVMFGHDVVNAKERRVNGLYCQGYVEYANGQGRDTASIIADSSKQSIASDVEILLLETLRYYWQKIPEGQELPYCFFPLSERALNEKGFINDLKSFLKSQKIVNPIVARALSRLVIVLPFTSSLYRHAEACQFLSADGIKLALLYSSGNTTLLNPILDEEPSLLLRMGIDFYLISSHDLQFLQEKLGYGVMSEKILTLARLRLMTLVFNVNDEATYSNLPDSVAMVMGKIFDKQAMLARLPLPATAAATPLAPPTDGRV